MAVIKEKPEDKKVNLNTKDLEMSLFMYYNNMGEYMCREVGMPDSLERVDYLRYSKKSNCWYFYELKLTVADFRSKCAKTFRGHFNYFVVPESIYDKIKDEVEPGIGVMIVKNNIDRYRNVASMETAKRAKKMPLDVDEQKLNFNFMQALSRENVKYVFGLKSENRHREKILEDELKYHKKMHESIDASYNKDIRNYESTIYDLEEKIKDLQAISECKDRTIDQIVEYIKEHYVEKEDSQSIIDKIVALSSK